MSDTMRHAAVGGVEEKDGKFVPFFELHSPCYGGDHKRCVVKRRDAMDACDSMADASGMLSEVHHEVGWEAEKGTI